MRKTSWKTQEKRVCADVTDPPQPGGMCKGRRSDSERPLSPEGSSQASPSPLDPLPRRLSTGAAARAAAGSHGVPDPENKHAHTAWGLGDGPRAEGQIYKVPVGPTLSLAAAPCVPGVTGVGVGGLPRQPAILAPAAAPSSFMRIRRVQGGEEKSSPEGTCPSLLLCYRHWGWGHSPASQSVRTRSGRGNPLPQEERQVPRVRGSKVFTKRPPASFGSAAQSLAKPAAH